MEITLGICGTAGRKDDAKRLSRQHFDAMYVVAEELLLQLKDCEWPIDTCISGGAAYADFVAVKLFLDKKVKHLRLFLPAPWENGAFHDNGIKNNSFKNPGATANYYHKKFQLTTGINSLSQMQIANMEGAEFIPVEKGFYARNYLVAKSSDVLLACTFGSGSQVKEGGTAHCVRCYIERTRKEGIFNKLFHYNLSDGQIYDNCTVPPQNELSTNS